MTNTMLSPHPTAPRFDPQYTGCLVRESGQWRVRCACGMRMTLDDDVLRKYAKRLLNRYGWHYDDRDGWQCPVCAGRVSHNNPHEHSMQERGA